MKGKKEIILLTVLSKKRSSKIQICQRKTGASSVITEAFIIINLHLRKIITAHDR